MGHLFLVGLGGGLGAVGRALLVGWAGRLARADHFPVGTLSVNLLGCCLAGLLAGLIARGTNLSTEARSFLIVGVLGGFTTFSAFGVDTVLLLRRGEIGTAVVYVGLSVVGGMTVLWLALAAVDRPAS